MVFGVESGLFAGWACLGEQAGGGEVDGGMVVGAGQFGGTGLQVDLAGEVLEGELIGGGVGDSEGAEQESEGIGFGGGEVVTEADDDAEAEEGAFLTLEAGGGECGDGFEECGEEQVIDCDLPVAAGEAEALEFVRGESEGGAEIAGGIGVWAFGAVDASAGADGGGEGG